MKRATSAKIGVTFFSPRLFTKQKIQCVQVKERRKKKKKKTKKKRNKKKRMKEKKRQRQMQSRV